MELTIGHSVKNYFKSHGSTMQGEEQKMLEKATWSGYKIKAHTLTSDGDFETQYFPESFTFVHTRKLYRFMTTDKGQIYHFFELNTNKQMCGKGASKCGIYYEIIKVKK